MKIDKNVCRIIFDFASKEKKAGKDATLSREFFLVVASAYPEPRSHIEVLNEVSKKWKDSKEKPTKLRQRLIGNLQQQGRRIKLILEPVFGDAISIENIPGLAWQLTLTDEFLEAIEKSKNKRELLVFLKGYGITAAADSPVLPKFLLPVEDVLQVDREIKDEDREWPRRGGPIACDFRAGLVCPPLGLAGFRDEVLSNPVSLLEGASATGKTVLVRQLAFDLCNEGRKVWFFDYASSESLPSPYDLADVICSTGGLTIIENVHLIPDDLQALYERIPKTKDSPTLLTARDSLRNFVSPAFQETLRNLPSLQLVPLWQVDHIIDHFFRREKGVWPSTEDRERIKEKSKGNFWLLILTLKGYCHASARGNPTEWISDWVKEDLSYLATKNPEFPRMLVALAPLSMGEMRTAQVFLTNMLGFSKADLLALYKTGAITRREEHDTFLFGIPHSALASVYWEYGKVYRDKKGPDALEAFLYDYTLSDAPNVFDAVNVAKGAAKERIMSRLHSQGQLAGVVAREKSFGAITFWADLFPPDTLDNADLLQVLEKRIGECRGKDIFLAVLCASRVGQSNKAAGNRLYACVDLELLARELTAATDRFADEVMLSHIIQDSPAIARKVVSLMDVKQLIRQVNKDVGVFGPMARYITLISEVSPAVGREVFQGIDLQGLAHRMHGNFWPSAIFPFLQTMRDLHEKRAAIACGYIDPKMFTKSLNDMRTQEGDWSTEIGPEMFRLFMDSACKLVVEIISIKKDTGEDILSLIEDKDLVRMIHESLRQTDKK